MKISKIYYLGAILLALSLLLKFFQNLDLQILYILNNLYFSDFALSFLTEMGNSFFIISFLTPLLSYLSYSIKKLNYVSPAVLIIPGILFGVIIQIIKNVFNFSRPGAVEGIDINILDPIFQSLSYPSGHAASILFFGFWWTQLALGHRFKSIRYLIYFLIISIAITRVIIGAHWFSDVIASFALALIYIETINKDRIINFLNVNFFLNITSVLIIILGIYSVFNFEVFDHI